MERFLNTKIEIRYLIVVVILLLMAAWVFGWMVFHRMSGGQRFGVVSIAAVSVASSPSIAKGLLTGELLRDEHEVSADFAEPFGFTFARPPVLPQYVLVSRYDGNIGWSTVELYREGDEDPLHVWKFEQPVDFAFNGGSHFARVPVEDESYVFRMVHPYLMSDGSLLIHSMYGAMYRVGKCGNKTWLNNEFGYHHSLEPSLDGNFWTPGAASTKIDGYGWQENTFDDHIVKISPDGEVLYAKSVFAILIEAGLINRIYDYDTPVLDPIHLNDIEPVAIDGTIAKRGDVFLSLGHLNMVLLFRPETDEVVWYSQDRMMHQHDVDMLGPDSISVYDNRRKSAETGEQIVLGTNELIRFDLPDQKARLFFLEQMQSMDISSFNQSLSDFIPGAGRMIEETARARLIKFGEDSELDWVFLNRSDDDRLWMMNWSRYVPAEYGDVVVEALASSDC